MEMRTLALAGLLVLGACAAQSPAERAVAECNKLDIHNDVYADQCKLMMLGVIQSGEDQRKASIGQGALGAMIMRQPQ